MRASEVQSWGSSPLTRGALQRRPHRAATFRLIPAHAGSTYAVARTPLPARAHPRSRGEHPVVD